LSKNFSAEMEIQQIRPWPATPETSLRSSPLANSFGRPDLWPSFGLFLILTMVVAAGWSVDGLQSAGWGPFYETVSAEIYRYNLIWSNFCL
jgi:hypothetical protein